jgi:hypothetical protein
MFAVPVDTPVITPLNETAATDAFEDDQKTNAPGIVLPFASFTTADACIV